MMHVLLNGFIINVLILQKNQKVLGFAINAKTDEIIDSRNWENITLF
jgi:hypothetical protein